MEREKPNFDILGRIDRERLARGWSEYTLAENSGLTQSTLSTWRRRNLQPNVTSIEKICHGLGITLSQFFEEDATIHHLTEEQKSLLNHLGQTFSITKNCYLGFDSSIFTRIMHTLTKRRMPSSHCVTRHPSSLSKGLQNFFQCFTLFRGQSDPANSRIPVVPPL